MSCCDGPTWLSPSPLHCSCGCGCRCQNRGAAYNPGAAVLRRLQKSDGGVSALPATSSWAYANHMDRSSRRASVVVLDGNLTPESLEAGAAVAREQGATTFFEPVSVPKARRAAGCLHLMHYLKPNTEELCALAQEIRDRAAPLTGTEPTLASAPDVWPAPLVATVQSVLPDIALVLRAGCRGIFLSLGGQGAMLCTLDRGGAIRLAHVPALPVKVASLVGAGDCFVGGAVSRLSRGSDPVEALLAGVAAATCSVQSLQNVPETLSPAALQPWIQLARDKLYVAIARPSP